MQPSYNILQPSYGISQPPRAMDWYSWLSKTGLDPSLVYTYGFAFSGNELQKEDLAYLNHEFLQSMGISVAKHRLEILKLARKEVRETSNGLSKFISAINKIRKYLKYVNKLVHHENSTATKALPAPAPVSYRDKWREALSKKELKIEHPMQRTRRKMAKSGPLAYRGQEKLLVTPRSLKLSGPLDRKLQESLMLNDRSPKVHGDNSRKKASGDFVEHTFWEALFQGMKPT